MTKGIEDLDFLDDDPVMQPEPQGSGDFIPDFDSTEPEKPWMDGTYVNEPAKQESTTAPTTSTTINEDDFILSMLNEIGIKDPSKIKFENEQGEIEEVSWSSLSIEEKRNILTPEKEDPNYGLVEAEINFINSLRDSDITPEEYIQYQKQQAIAEYVQNLEGNPQYEVEKLSNEDLYILDIQSRVPDMTDEELTIALENEKANPELFEKKMQGIRSEYKALEDERRQHEELLDQQDKQDQFAEFQDSILEAIQSFDEVGGVKLNLDRDDMEEVANFILSLDSAGVSYLGKAIDDPQTLTRMAWFALKGDEAFETITEYYNTEITKQAKLSYEAGYEDAKKGAQPKGNKKPEVSVRPASTQNSAEKSAKTINDLDF